MSLAGIGNIIGCECFTEEFVDHVCAWTVNQETMIAISCCEVVSGGGGYECDILMTRMEARDKGDLYQLVRQAVLY